MSHLAGALKQSEQQERLQETNTQNGYRLLQLLKGLHARVHELNIWEDGGESNPKGVLSVNGFNKGDINPNV